MLVTVDGIIIGRRTIGDNNCFIDVLTDEYGVIEATAHGIRKITSKNAGACNLFAYSKFCFSKSGLKYTLNSAEPKHSFHGISSDLEALSLAVYFSELMKATATSEQGERGLVRFLAISLFEVEKRRIPLAQIKAVFELRLAAMIGFAPDLRACRECLCYEHEKMFFNFGEGFLLCGDCLGKGGADGLYELPHALLYAMRFIVYSPDEKIYFFKISNELLGRLSAVCEQYLLTHLDRGFKSLDYYKNLSL